MSKVLITLKHEFFEVLPPTIFFFVAFNVISITNALMLRQYSIPIIDVTTATVGALIVGKVVLVVDKFKFINKFPDKPLIYNVLWKTLIYVVAALIVRYVEHLLPSISEYGSVREASAHLVDDVIWTRFWAVQIWLLVLFFVFSALREFIRVVGQNEVLRMFFGHSSPA